jgi:O-succinylhomoserine sulfhydrylase
MPADHSDPYAFATLGCRAGTARSSERENSDPIYATSSFSFESAAQAAAVFAGAEDGNIYSRFGNPTVRAFEERLAALEGGERALAFSSGMSAILSVCMSLLKSGDHIVCSRAVFGTTIGLFQGVLPNFGVTTTFVELTSLEAWQRAIKPETKLLFVETPSNPLTEIADLAALAALAHAHDVLLVVDNCFCSPALQQPIAFGADIVVHSATKYLDGQGRCVGGAVVGQALFINEKLFPFLRAAGPNMSPFNAWVFLKSLETLKIRMAEHSRSAQEIASWLEAHPKVRRVLYPGLASHPQHELAKRQQRAPGGVLSFEVDGGRSAAWRVSDETKLFSITGNLGDTRSIITHPATTTHGRLSDEDKLAMGITEGLLRLSIGLEETSDLIADLDFALSRA